MSTEQLTPFFNLGIAGVALYLIYDIAKKALEGLKTSIDNNTKALNDIREVIAKCKKVD